MWREKIKSILSWQKGREAKGRAEKKEFPELRGKQDKKELFQKAILQESRKAIQNPGCGWYHLYTFNAAQTGEPLYIACEEEELVLLRIDIGAFRDKPISEPSLEWIRRILAFFREKRKGMILRFSYDLEGKGLEKEPGSIRLVEEHMQQIGEVIREYADDIFAVQGKIQDLFPVFFYGNFSKKKKHLLFSGLPVLNLQNKDSQHSISDSLQEPPKWC